MSEPTRYHFYRKRAGQVKWWCSRKNESGTLNQFIADLKNKYDVTTEDNRNYFITDKQVRAEGLDK